jgi:Putative adhesin
VSITEDAPVHVAPQQRERTATTTVAWWWLVAVSGLILVLAGGTLFAWWALTRETVNTSYRVLGDVAGVRLDLGAADVEIDGGATAIEIRQTDKFAFGQPSSESHAVENGTLRVVSRCPEQVLGACHATFHVSVPDNVPLDIETSSGTVHLTGVRTSVKLSTGSGAITAANFCGFSFSATSDSGDVGVRSECSADRLEAHSRSGDVNVTVPPGRYSVDAQSDTGTVHTRGLDDIEDAGFQIQAQSGSGDVTVETSS